LEKHPEAKEFHKKALPHYKQLHEVFSGSVATGNYAFSSLIEDDDDISAVDDEVAVINSNNVGVVEVMPTRPLSSLSTNTRDTSKKSSAAVSSGKRKRKVSKQESFLEQLV